MQDYRNNIDGCHIPPHEPIQDAMEASLTRKGIRQRERLNCRLTHPQGF